MFTGLVADIGKIKRIAGGTDGARLEIGTSLVPNIDEGDSIAVGGVCLTATEVHRDSFEADAMAQTLSLTTLGSLEKGDAVNLELALRASDRLGGHIVQGHVDGVGEVTSAVEDGIAKRVEISAPADLLPLIAARGSIAVDGVSLTVSGLGDETFEVSLIPETLERTTLGSLEQGGRVNLEVDVVARYLQRANTAMQPSDKE